MGKVRRLTSSNKQVVCGADDVNYGYNNTKYALTLDKILMHYHPPVLFGGKCSDSLLVIYPTCTVWIKVENSFISSEPSMYLNIRAGTSVIGGLYLIIH